MPADSDTAAGAPPARISNIARGVAWMLGVMLSFVAMALAVRELSSDMSSFQILSYRAAIGILLMTPWALRAGMTGLATARMKMHASRSIIHFGGTFSWVTGITFIPLAEVIAIEFTSPLFVVILALIFLKERIDVHRWGATFLGFVGILVILRPGVAAISPGAFIVLFAALCYAGSYIALKSLTRTENPNLVVFLMNVIQLPMALVPALFLWVHPPWSDVPLILILGVTGFTAHYSMARAFAWADVSLMVPIDFLRLPVLGIAAFFLYAETPDPWTMIGGAIIFGSNYYMVAREARRAKGLNGAETG